MLIGVVRILVLILRYLLIVWPIVFIDRILIVIGSLLLRVSVVPCILYTTLGVIVVQVVVVLGFLIVVVVIGVDGHVAVRRRDSLVGRMRSAVMVCTIHLGISTRIIGASVACRWVVIALISR